MPSSRTFAFRQTLAAVCVLSSLACVYSQETEQPEIDFARDVRPLLSDRCFACHGPDTENRQADLRVDQWESLVDQRNGTPAIRPNDAPHSELVRRITSTDPDERMPPDETGKPLSADEVQTLVKWIQGGAKWEQHWAYELPRPVPTPLFSGLQLTGSLSPQESKHLRADQWIDRFIAQKLAAAGGQFSPAADRITLARRLSFDLTGLPPTPEHMATLLADASELAIDGYVDQLLASPACGERLASYWLDLVRFADTVGYHGDQDHHISLYRDYVINALNDNRGFDQFTLEQLAGDLLPHPTDEQVIATGYNRMLQTSHEGGVQAKEYLAMYAADRVRNLSAVWMGATVGCAQCHDHKFDPYTAHDFYALSAFFADIDEAQHLKGGSDSVPTRRAPEKSFLDRAQRLQLDRVRQQLDQLSHTAVDESPPQAQLDSLNEQLEHIQAAARKTMITVSIAPRTIRYLPRGNWLDDSGDIMLPRVPEFLQATFRVQAESGARPTRLDLARWLIDDQRGVGLLTARVQVNRLWMLMFGHGLSRSLEDFGGQGEAPSHPELLDRLALEFVRCGWDIKHMLRTITSSRTYRQSSLETQWHRAHDPLNRLWARQNRFRVSAEMVRDTALACSGLLVTQLGGASVKPYQPEDYYRHLNFPPRKYAPSTDQGQWRRGIYVHWQRQFLHPMLLAFDAPRREECTSQRSQSNTPLAALVWLNDPSFIEAARALAVRALQLNAADHERVAWMFQTVTSRSPDQREHTLLEQLLEQARAEFDGQTEQARKLLHVGLLPVDESCPPEELAAWTSVARAALNLNETYTRN